MSQYAPGVPWSRQTPAEIDALFARQRTADPFGLRLHEWAAIAACVLGGFPTAAVTFAAGPVLLIFLVRMITHHRVLGPLWWEGVVRAMVAWSAWLALSLLWSADRRLGTDEVGTLAFGLLVPALYPVLDRRPVLVRAVILGLFCGVASQGVHILGRRLHVDALTWHRLPGRDSGWWDPVIAGSLLCALVGLTGASLWLGRSVRERLFGALGVVVALAALALTGTRGAWIGGAITLGAGASAGLVSRLGSLRSRPHADPPSGVRAPGSGARAWIVPFLLAVAAVSIAAWLVNRPALRQRVEAGVNDVRAALESGNYTTDTGARIAMWEWAYAAWRCHPVVGVGAGGYRAWVHHQAQMHHMAQEPTVVGEAGAAAETAETPCPHRGPITGGGSRVHAHAHGLWPQVAATTGTIGVAIMLWLLGSAIVSGVRPQRRASDATSEGAIDGAATQETALDRAGPPLALVGLAAAGLFDSISVNQQTWYLAMVLVALCVSRRPAPWHKPIRAREFRGVGGVPIE